jgi:hypothetical protein
MLDPSKCLIVGHREIHPALAEWFQRHGFQKRIIVPAQVRPMLCARNVGVKLALELAEKHGFERIVFCDSDVMPAETATDEWLQLDADLTSCRCDTDNPAAFGGAEAFHWALSSVSVAILKQITAPWVRSEYNEDGTQLAGCDCATFAKRCKALGATIAHGGYCIHQHRGSWHTAAY